MVDEQNILLLIFERRFKLKKSNTYKITSTIGAIIRMYFIANAFEGYFDNILIAMIINDTIGEFILRKTTYHISVGSIYEKYSFPTGGSILYTLFYIFNNLIMTGACYVCKWLNIGWGWIFVLYFIALIAYVYLMNLTKRKLTDEFLNNVI